MRLFLLSAAAVGLAACQTADVAAPAPQGLSVPAPMISPSDFAVILGDGWTGELTYLDYSSGETVAIPATLSVGPINGQSIGYAFGYPDEPDANSPGVWEISADGQALDGKTVTRRSDGVDGEVVLILEYDGEDDNKPARVTETLVLTADALTFGKTVQFDGGDAFQRNSYAFER